MYIYIDAQDINGAHLRTISIKAVRAGARGAFPQKHLARGQLANAERDVHRSMRQRMEVLYPDAKNFMRPYYFLIPLKNMDFGIFMCCHS